MYNDGYAVESLRSGTVAVTVTRGDPVSPEQVDVRSCATSMMTFKYQAELCVLRDVLLWLSEHAGEWMSAMTASDSLSALTAVRSTSVGRASGLLGRVVALGVRVSGTGEGLVWNAWADREAGEASGLRQDGEASMYNSAQV